MRRFLTFTLALTVLFSLTACSEEDKTEPDFLNGKVYVPEAVDIDLALDFVDSCCAVGEDFYILGAVEEVEGMRSVLCRVPIDGSAGVELEDFAPGILDVPDGGQANISVNGLCAGEDGTMWVMERDNVFTFDLPEDFDEETGNKWDYQTLLDETEVMRQLDGTGAEVNRVDLSPLGDYLENGAYMAAFAFDGEGDCWAVASDGNVIVLDGEMAPRFSVPLFSGELTSPVQLSDGRIGFGGYTGAETGYVLKTVDKKSQSWEEAYILPVGCNRVYPGSGGFLFFCGDSSSLYGYDGKTEEYEQLLYWDDVGVSPSDLICLTMGAGGEMTALLYREGQLELVRLTLTDAASVPRKTTLTIGCLKDSDIMSELHRQIAKFNQSSATLRIEFKEYAGEDRWDLTRLTTEITAGRIPDMLVMDTLPVRQYGAKGLLEDLWPYIENDPELGRESVMEHVLECVEQEGKLYQIADSFAIRTVVGAKAVVGDRMSWTLDDLQAALETMPEGCTAYNPAASKLWTLESFLYSDLDKYVDWENGTCSFDDEGFKNILTFCNKMKYTTQDWSNPEFAIQQNIPDMAILEGRQMLYDNTSISNFFKIQQFEALFGGPVSFVGDPRSDGKCGSSFSLNVAGLCMTTACKDKEGAWEFMRQLLLPHGIKSTDIPGEYYFYSEPGFPINREDFELLAQLSLHPEEPGHIAKENGLYDVEYGPLTQEEYDQVMALYNAVDGFYAEDSTVWDIIEEQVQPYFAGDKSLDETIDLIQGRVELYVNEQR